MAAKAKAKTPAKKKKAATKAKTEAKTSAKKSAAKKKSTAAVDSQKFQLAPIVAVVPMGSISASLRLIVRAAKWWPTVVKR